MFWATIWVNCWTWSQIWRDCGFLLWMKCHFACQKSVGTKRGLDSGMLIGDLWWCLVLHRFWEIAYCTKPNINSIINFCWDCSTKYNTKFRTYLANNEILEWDSKNESWTKHHLCVIACYRLCVAMHSLFPSSFFISRSFFISPSSLTNQAASVAVLSRLDHP